MWAKILGEGTIVNKVNRVGAVRTSPRFFDKQQTLGKTCHYVEEGGKLGLDLLVFPEVYALAELEAMLKESCHRVQE